ncbi:hypothetical protein HK405_009466 [Cladochytrium tenue]|nr:hypothetical protein HK405_009466 [Cladochytrium tenue]
MTHSSARPPTSSAALLAAYGLALVVVAVSSAAAIPIAAPQTDAPAAAPSGNSSSSQSSTVQIQVPGVLGGLILIATGLAFALLGKRTFLPTIFLSGFFTFGTVVVIILDILQGRWRSFGPGSEWVYLLTAAPIALGGGLLYIRTPAAGVVSVGALAGLSWGAALLFTGAGASLGSEAQALVLVGLTSAGVAAVFVAEHGTLVAGTATAGGAAAASGADLLARTGFVEALQAGVAASPPPRAQQVPGPAWALLAAAAGIAVLGWYLQTRPGPAASPPASPYNPAYWLFGAAPPAAPPAAWLKMPGAAPPPAAPAGAGAAAPPARRGLADHLLSPFGLRWIW